jgi:predicted amidohydrolase
VSPTRRGVHPTGVTRVVCQQMAPVVGDLAANRALILDAADRSLRMGGDVIVLPELATSGYVLGSREEARSVAITRDDVLFVDLARALGGTDSVIVLGFAEHGTSGAVHNSVAAVTAQGVLAVYRKTHLWDRETLLFTPGDTAPPIVETVHGRVGVLVCYDLEFPEMPRSLALAGADILAVPTNWPRGERPEGERAPEVTFAQAAARANGVFVACCDRRGLERGQSWNEDTVIIDQYGWIRSAARGTQAPPGTEDPDAEHPHAVADVFPRLARDKAISPHNDLLADRRPDIYSQENPRW